MSRTNPTSFAPYVHPADLARNLAPDVSLMVDGLDWAWMFVWYKDVPDHPGYRVGSDGSFWTRWKQVRNPIGGTTYVLGDRWIRRRCHVNKRGYVICCVGRSDTIGEKHRRLHTLVLEAFVGTRPDGMEGCHNDGNPQNNAITNLRWDTPQSNVADRTRHGRSGRAFGEGHGRSKLKATDPPRIIELRNSGMTLRRIAELFGVSQKSISNVLQRKTWSHVAV